MREHRITRGAFSWTAKWCLDPESMQCSASWSALDVFPCTRLRPETVRLNPSSASGAGQLREIWLGIAVDWLDCALATESRWRRINTFPSRRAFNHGPQHYVRPARSPIQTMKLDKIQACVAHGLCTWEQVAETLQNAQLPQAETTLFMDGSLALGHYVSSMLHYLIETGTVPTPPKNAYVREMAGDFAANADEFVNVPELLYCLDVLRTMPSEAPDPTMDAMFGTYRRIALTETWVRERFGECDAHFGPHQFFAYQVFHNDRHIATVWARDNEADHELLKSQLWARFDIRGVLAVRREMALDRKEQ